MRIIPFVAGIDLVSLDHSLANSRYSAWTKNLLWEGPKSQTYLMSFEIITKTNTTDVLDHDKFDIFFLFNKMFTQVASFLHELLMKR